MTDELKAFIEANDRSTERAVEKYVNGGIRAIKDDVNLINTAFLNMGNSLNAHLQEEVSFRQRIEPIVVAYERQKAFNDEVMTYGNRMLWIAKVIGALGVVALAAKETMEIVPQLIGKIPRL